MDLLSFTEIYGFIEVYGFLIENSSAFTKILQRKMNHIAFEMKQRKNHH